MSDQPTLTMNVKEEQVRKQLKSGDTLNAHDYQLDPGSCDFSFESWATHMFQDPAKCRMSKTGVAYRNLNVFGFGTQTDYQKTFANCSLVYLNLVRSLCGSRRKSKIDILRDIEGVINSGDMLVVLGRPGSGCSTFLKTLAGQTYGFHVDGQSMINYQGVLPKIMHSEFRGECTYQAESDVHFPHLTVGQILAFSASARAPKNAIGDPGRGPYAVNVKNAIASALRLSHTLQTKAGDNFVRGVSGGERKRTSIAEILVGGAPFQCWDNATRGLDSESALKFVNVLRVLTAQTGSVGVVSLYQASQAIYNVFDKVLLLYEGRQIYFGSTRAAKAYFTELGFVCPERATTADFLTSLTNPSERHVREGYENRVPHTADEFANTWKLSSEGVQLLKEVEIYEKKFPIGDSSEQLHNLRVAQKSYKATGQRSRSPFTVAIPQQISLCITRGFQRLRNDLATPISNIVGNCIMSIILGSMFYNLSEDTNSFFGRGVLLFFTVLLNTFLGAFESVALWAQKPIVEKHFQFALYHPFTEAMASAICDIPNKILLTLFFNIPLYFLANLRRTPSAFFTFFLFAFVSLLTGSFHFRFTGAVSRTITGSIAPGSTFAMMLLIFGGYVLPIPSMPVWFRWFHYINPLAYAFESMMINEFSGRVFSCSNFIPQGPGYANIDPGQRMCSTVGSQLGSTVVEGDQYLVASFQFYPKNLWRNLAVIFAIMAFLCTLYLLASEYVPAKKTKGEILVFRRGKLTKYSTEGDEEAQSSSGQGSSGRRAMYRVSSEKVNADPKSSTNFETHAATFLWDELNYDVPVKKGSRRLLADVEGWIKPGTLTALMGASGAGKTTLLNVLANRASTGIVAGEMLTDAKYQNDAFARKVGYAQQQDLHLPTSTVREALEFSALLRQSEKYSKAERLAYVDETIRTLDMENFADAVIGVLGEGLNIEQRKRVTIGVELAARPDLLIFLDEPTSGLDSDTAWSICTLLKKLSKNGQAILCTIHQPSGTVFEMFDRLLFLSDGNSIYFGDIGHGSKVLTTYFEGHGARKCGIDENPAEWLLNIAEGAPNPPNNLNWTEIWRNSVERKSVKEQLTNMKELLSSGAIPVDTTTTPSQEYATSLVYQLYMVTRRNLENVWRTPSYLWSKIFLTAGMGLLNGFSFYNSPNSLQGVQNLLFSVFILMFTFSNINQLIIPPFIDNRALYEIREQPSRTYSWKVFILSSIIAEMPWQTLLAVVSLAAWYFPLGLYHNAIATDQLNERAGLVFLLLWSYMIFCSTFAQMVATIMPDAATGVSISSLLYSLCLIFSGVLVNPQSLPRFWIWMYYISPVTYFISALISPSVAGVPITCTGTEVVQFNPPSGQNCASYLQDYLSYANGNLLNPNATDRCRICPIADTNSLLGVLGIHFEDRWRNLGISIMFSLANIALALLLYWLVRIPRGASNRKF